MLNDQLPYFDQERGYKYLQYIWNTLHGDPALAGAMVLALTSPVPWVHTWLSSKVSWLTVWVECLSTFFSATHLGLLRSLGLPLLFVRLAQTLPGSLFLLQRFWWREHPYPLEWWAGTHTPPMSHFGQSPLPKFPPDHEGYKWLWLSWQFHSCYMVGQSTQSWLVSASFVGQHSIYHLTLGQAVEHGMLAMVLMAGSWKSLATWGPTLGTKCCHRLCCLSQNWRHNHTLS